MELLRWSATDLCNPKNGCIFSIANANIWMYKTNCICWYAIFGIILIFFWYLFCDAKAEAAVEIENVNAEPTRRPCGWPIVYCLLFIIAADAFVYCQKDDGYWQKEQSCKGAQLNPQAFWIFYANFISNKTNLAGKHL